MYIAARIARAAYAARDLLERRVGELELGATACASVSEGMMGWT
jgi:hypothetical protein